MTNGYRTQCTRCGQALSAANITEALNDIGEGSDQLRVAFYCPRYNPDTDTCPGYDSADAAAMAYWELH